MSTTILMRVALSEEEWAELRKGAIDARKPLKDYLAEILRAFLNGKDSA